MGLVIWIALGMIAGSVAKAIVPGPNPLGHTGSVMLGIGEALTGGTISAYSGGSFMDFDVRSLLMAISGSLAALFCYRSYACAEVLNTLQFSTATAACW